MINPNLVFGAAGAVGTIWYAVHTWLSSRADRADKQLRATIAKAITDAMKQNNEDTTDIKERLVRIETDQFGMNHGGLREKVNNLDHKVDALAIDVATIKGALSERKN